MKKILVSGVAVLFLLVTMATAHAYTSSFTGATGNFFLGGIYGTGPITIAFSNVTATGVVVDLPPSGVYDWSIGLSSFTVDLGGTSAPEFSVGPYAIDIGTYAMPVIQAPGSTNLGDVTIPFSIFGLGGGSLALDNLDVSWSALTTSGGYGITFSVSADDMTELLSYLVQMDGLANAAGDSDTNGGIGGIFSASDGYLTAAPVPEPATMLLLGSGLVGLMGYRRKFKK